MILSLSLGSATPDNTSDVRNWINPTKTESTMPTTASTLAVQNITDLLNILLSKEVFANFVQAVGILGVSIIYPLIQEKKRLSHELIKANIHNKEKALAEFSKIISTVLMLHRTYKNYFFHYKQIQDIDSTAALADKEAYRPILRDLYLSYIKMETTYDAVCAIAKLEFNSLESEIDEINKNIALYIKEECSRTDKDQQICINPDLDNIYGHITKEYEIIIAKMHKIITEARLAKKKTTTDAHHLKSSAI